MKILENEKLDKYTTFKMGGMASKMYFPEDVNELMELTNSKPYLLNYLIGGGSNLIINDEKIFQEVVCLRNFNDIIRKNEDGTFYIGASTRLQKAINEINENNYGGIEYLFSVPGLIGGAIYMNAGRGKRFNQSISDYIVNVDFIENGKLYTLNKEECCFGYRKSIFQEKKCIIIGALFRFPNVPKEESKMKVKERLDLCKEKQDMSAPNFGTVFCESNKYIMEFVRGVHLGYKNGVQFSKKTKNWMLHKKEGNYKQTIQLINKVKKIHKIFRKKCKLEAKIWE